MPSKLRPLQFYRAGKYPKAEKRLFRGLLVATAMTATSLGGCGPGIDSRSVDDALDASDLDGTVDDCDGSADAAGCSQNDVPSSDTKAESEPAAAEKIAE